MEKTWVYGHRMRGVNAAAAILNQLRMGRKAFTVDDLMMNTNIDSDDMKNELSYLVSDSALRKLDEEWYAVNGGERTFHEYVLKKSKEACSVSYGVPPEEAYLLELEEIVRRKWTFDDGKEGGEQLFGRSRGRRKRSYFFENDDDDDNDEVKPLQLTPTQARNRDVFVAMGYKFDKEPEESENASGEDQSQKKKKPIDKAEEGLESTESTEKPHPAPSDNDAAVSRRIAPRFDAWEDEDKLKKAVCDLLIDRIRSYGSSSPWAMRRNVLTEKIAYSDDERNYQLYDRLAYELGICRPSEYVELCKLIKNPPAIEDDPDKGRIETAVAFARQKGFVTAAEVCEELSVTAAEAVEIVRKMCTYGFVISSRNGFRYVDPVSENDVSVFDGESVITLLVRKYRKGESD